MPAAVETMAYAGKTPWHGLGTQVEDTLTPAEMLKAADLDWTVDKRPLLVDVNGTSQNSDMFGLVRKKGSEETYLGPCGAKYVPSQNADVFRFFDRFVKAGHMKMETAGSLHGGRHIWALANIQSSFALRGKDEVRGYLLLHHPHVWGKSLTIQFTPIRVVCWNTLSYALNTQSGGYFSMPHIQAFDDLVIERAEEALGIATNQLKDFEAKARFLSKKEFTENGLNRYIATLFQPNLIESDDNVVRFEDFTRNAFIVRETVHSQPGHDLPTKNTFWAAFNAVTYCVDHEFGNTQDARLNQAWFGAKAVLKRKALDVAVEFAEAA